MLDDFVYRFADMSSPEAAETDEALAAQYVLDELAPDRRQLFEARLRAEPDLLHVVQARRATLAQLTERLPSVEPANGVWQAIGSALDGTSPALQSSPPRSDGAAVEGCADKNC